MFLNVRESLFFLFLGKTVRIEPATSLFIISHPVCDAVVRNSAKTVAQQMLIELLPSKLVLPWVLHHTDLLGFLNSRKHFVMRGAAFKVNCQLLRAADTPHMP